MCCVDLVGLFVACLLFVLFLWRHFIVVRKDRECTCTFGTSESILSEMASLFSFLFSHLK